MMTDEEFQSFWNDPDLGKALKRRLPQTFRTKSKMKTSRCGACIDCKKTDCGNCLACLDKAKFGGPGLRKQGCLSRGICKQPIVTHYWDKTTINQATKHTAFP